MHLNWSHGKIWYDCKTENSTKVLILPGGPGLSHHYLQNLSFLEEIDVYPVFFDPLGSGLSQLHDNPSIDLALQEINTIHAHTISNEPYYLFGHSSGGWLAIEAIKQKKLPVPKALILSNSGCNNRVFLRHAKWLLLGQGIQDYVSIRNGLQNKHYSNAYNRFIKKHILRIYPIPDCYVQSIQLSSHKAYSTLWGNNEIFPTGELKDWKAKPPASIRNIPTLVIHGKHDEVPMKSSKSIFKNCPNAEKVLFKNSSHCPHLEEFGLFKNVVIEFIRTIVHSDISLPTQIYKM